MGPSNGMVVRARGRCFLGVFSPQDERHLVARLTNEQLPVRQTVHFPVFAVNRMALVRKTVHVTVWSKEYGLLHRWGTTVYMPVFP